MYVCNDFNKRKVFRLHFFAAGASIFQLFVVKSERRKINALKSDMPFPGYPRSLI